MSKNADVLVEAAERLALLGFNWDDPVVQDALAGKKPKCSNNVGISIVRELTDEEWDRVMEFQNRSNTIVYHVIRSDFGVGGILYDYLYFSLSSNDEDCDRDREDLNEHYPFVYTQNLNYQLSKYAYIGVEFRHNILVRIL